MVVVHSKEVNFEFEADDSNWVDFYVATRLTSQAYEYQTASSQVFTSSKY